MPHYFKPSLFMLLSTFTLASSGLLSKLLTEHFSEILLVFLRLWVPALIMLLLAVCTQWAIPSRDAWRALTIRAVFIVSCQSCFLVALSRISLIEAVVLFSTGPLFIPVLERLFFKIKISRLLLPTFTLMVIGVILQNITEVGLIWRWELLIGLAAGFFNGCSQVALFRASKIDLPVLVINGWCFAIAALFVVPMLVLNQQAIDYTYNFNQLANITEGLPYLLLLLGLSTVATQFYRSKAYRLVASNSELAPLIYTNLVFALFFQLIFYDTKMTTLQIVGACLIVLATLLNTFAKQRLFIRQAKLL